MRDKRAACVGGPRRAHPGGAVLVVPVRARCTLVRQARLSRAAVHTRTAVHAAWRVLSQMHASNLR